VVAGSAITILSYVQVLALQHALRHPARLSAKADMHTIIARMVQLSSGMNGCYITPASTRLVSLSHVKASGLQLKHSASKRKSGASGSEWTTGSSTHSQQNTSTRLQALTLYIVKV